MLQPKTLTVLLPWRAGPARVRRWKPGTEPRLVRRGRALRRGHRGHSLRPEARLENSGSPGTSARSQRHESAARRLWIETPARSRRIVLQPKPRSECPSRGEEGVRRGLAAPARQRKAARARAAPPLSASFRVL